MRRFVLIPLLVELFLVPSFVFAQETTFPPIPSIPCVAHRGFSAFYPENTIVSALKAIEVGAQGSEFDVKCTTDGVLFLTHDPTLKRTTGLDVACDDVDFPTLAKLDAGAFKGADFKGEHVATYDEALQTFKGTQTHPVVEIKGSGYEEKIVAYIQKYDMVSDVVIISGVKQLRKVRDLEPNVCTAVLCRYDVKKESAESIAEKVIKACNTAGTNVVDIEFHAVTPEFLKLMDDAGITVMCWTVDKPEDIDRLVKIGVKSITTNRPDLVLEAQAKYGAEKE